MGGPPPFIVHHSAPIAYACDGSLKWTPDERRRAAVHHFSAVAGVRRRVPGGAAAGRAAWGCIEGLPQDVGDPGAAGGVAGALDRGELRRRGGGRRLSVGPGLAASGAGG